MARGATDAAHLNVRDINNGALAEVWFTFPSGEKMNCMHVISLSTTAEKEKEQKHVLGMIQSGNKSLGVNFSGTMTVYDITTRFRKEMENYVNTGEDMYGQMDVISYDNTSSTGRQSVSYFGVNIDSLELSKIDINASSLETDVAFTFESFTINQSYDDLDGLF